MKSHAKMAIIYGAICGGCDVSLVNVGEHLADILEKFNIIYWSIAVDGKTKILRDVSEIDVAIFMGSIRTEENLELAKLIKEKSKLIVAYGSCACYGGIPGLGTLINPRKIMETMKSTITSKGDKPGRAIYDRLRIPPLLNTCNPLTKVVEPDILVPGCPPPPKSIERLFEILSKFLNGEKPPKGLVLAETKSQCDECPRKPKDMTKLVMPGVFRLHEVVPQEDKCFLEQGIICLGPITRAGCDHCCIKANMPCIGCMGPLPEVDDVGLKFISSIASILLTDKEKEIGEQGLMEALNKIADPQGIFYKYTLPVSHLIEIALKRRRREK